MITLYQFPPGFGLPNASPFCMKVETYLRMTGLAYRLDNRGLMHKAPKGKLPFIDADGERIGDSHAIITWLEQRHGTRLDDGLDPGQRALGVAFTRLIEEDLYWAVLYTRWFTDAGWRRTREVFFGTLPGPLRWVVPPLARRGMRQQLWGHGMGRHTAAEIMEIGQSDVQAISDFLADKPFLLGPRPSTVDASAYAFLANILWVPVESPIKQRAQALPNLEAYCQRMRQRYFGEGSTG